MSRSDIQSDGSIDGNERAIVSDHFVHVSLGDRVRRTLSVITARTHPLQTVHPANGSGRSEAGHREGSSSDTWSHGNAQVRDRAAASDHSGQREPAPIDATEPLVRFSGVRKTYDGKTLIIRNLDLDIEKGAFLTLLGPSGSGKTTCLMMLAGFETPTQGTITLDGHRLDNLPPHKRNIGMVFQNYALFPHMTVGENLAFPLSVRRLSKADIAAKVIRALDMVRLHGYEDRRPTQLSGGQQQRVALARALVFEPRLVLMDEPLGALDKQLREYMQLEIKQLHATLGITVAYVTHDQGEALTMSDRIAVFNDGIIQQIGPPRVIYEEPANSFVAQFIGENNRLDGTIETIDGDYCAVRLNGGERVIARAVNVAGPGQPTSISLRPEKVRTDASDHSVPLNQITACVRDLLYLGDHARLLVTVDKDREFAVKQPVSPMTAGLMSGATIPLFFAADDCRALDPV
jgi:putative spermidine/putrescine transport system ATP-binding protein